MTEMNPCRVITPLCRLSYPHLTKPAEMSGKYQAELIFPPGTDLSALRTAANLAATNKWGSKLPNKVRSPFRDGDKDREGKDGYEGCQFIGARATEKPGVVIGPNRDECLDPSEVYGGCWVRASVTAFAYEWQGTHGVSFALNNIWKVKDGEPFGTRISAQDEFEDVDSVGAGLI